MSFFTKKWQFFGKKQFWQLKKNNGTVWAIFWHSNNWTPVYRQIFMVSPVPQSHSITNDIISIFFTAQSKNYVYVTRWTQFFSLITCTFLKDLADTHTPRCIPRGTHILCFLGMVHSQWHSLTSFSSGHAWVCSVFKYLQWFTS